MSFLSSLFDQQQTAPTQIQSVVDLVTYTASLASKPMDIDPLLDKVRGITANLSPGQSPSPSDIDSLLGLYLQLEQYLITKEPIRNFTKEELRGRLTPQLRQQLTAFESNPKRGA